MDHSIVDKDTENGETTGGAYQPLDIFASCEMKRREVVPSVLYRIL
jgi:hypothetical protein